MTKRFIIRLKEPHERSGLTIYAVAKRANVAFNTVKKYVTADVESMYLPNHVIQICDALGVDWHDPAIVEIVETEDPHIKSLLTVPAL